MQIAPSRGEARPSRPPPPEATRRARLARRRRRATHAPPSMAPPPSVAQQVHRATAKSSTPRDGARVSARPHAQQHRRAAVAVSCHGGVMTAALASASLAAGAPSGGASGLPPAAPASPLDNFSRLELEEGREARPDLSLALLLRLPLGDPGMRWSTHPNQPSFCGAGSGGGLASRCCKKERKARMYAVECTVSKLLCVAPSIHAGGSGWYLWHAWCRSQPFEKGITSS
mmetsp:Transcript_69620/g.191059  ORF Transcript_69620/g.191059 Transcript_69620/m.191059 type:complete len:229 (-) Transcript_69620:535-1221(-)